MISKPAWPKNFSSALYQYAATVAIIILLVTFGVGASAQPANPLNDNFQRLHFSINGNAGPAMYKIKLAGSGQHENANGITYGLGGGLMYNATPNVTLSGNLFVDYLRTSGSNSYSSTNGTSSTTNIYKYQNRNLRADVMPQVALKLPGSLQNFFVFAGPVAGFNLSNRTKNSTTMIETTGGVRHISGGNNVYSNITDGVHDIMYGMTIGAGYNIAPFIISAYWSHFFTNYEKSQSEDNRFSSFNVSVAYVFYDVPTTAKVPPKVDSPIAMQPTYTPVGNRTDDSITGYGIEITRCDKSFLPTAIGYTQFTATIYMCDGSKWIPLGPGDQGKVITLELHNTSTEPGHCMNFGTTEAPDIYFPKKSQEAPNGNIDKDFTFGSPYISKDHPACEEKLPSNDRSKGGLIPNPGHQATQHWQTITTKNPVTSVTITVRTEDFGAFSWISAEADGCVPMPTREPDQAGPNCDNTDPLNPGLENAAGCCMLKTSHHVKINYDGPGSEFDVKNCWAKIPRDNNDNGIADTQANDKTGAGFAGGTRDIDATPTGNGTAGDGLTAYEEYRGFLEHVALGGNKHKLVHTRTSIENKDLFVLIKHESDSKFDDGYFEYFADAGLTTHLLRNIEHHDVLMGSPGHTGTWGGVSSRPSNEINYNRKDYRGLANNNACAQHCLPLMDSKDFAGLVSAHMTAELARQTHNAKRALDDETKSKIENTVSKPYGRVFSQEPTASLGLLEGNPDDFVLQTDDGSPGSPDSVFVVAVNIEKCSSGPRTKQVIAHELGHGVGIWHHGLQQREPCLFPPNDGKHAPNEIKGYLDLHKVNSGNERCIMRYDQLGLGWYENGDCSRARNRHDYKSTGPGINFCTSPTGTGINAAGATTNDAEAGKGNCKHQVKVKDW